MKTSKKWKIRRRCLATSRSSARLFRSNVDQHLKRHLVIFVSARLINPAGEAVRLDEENEEIVETLPLPEAQTLTDLPLMPK